MLFSVQKEALTLMLRATKFFMKILPQIFWELVIYVVTLSGQELLLLHVVQTGSGVHPTSHTMGTGSSSPGVKRPGREVDHSPPTSPEVKKMWIYTSIPPCAFMA
jgi:hypothetical protein